MESSKIKVFVDFDGTLSLLDVGREIFYTFGNKEKAEEIVSQFQNGIITSRQCWDLLIKNLNYFNHQKLIELIDNIPIDQTFKDFVQFCKNNHIEIFILSDGFDFYVERILNRENLKGIPFYANSLKVEGEKLLISFPYFNPDYPHSSNPKMIHIIDNSSDEDFTIYIGDGNSDKEAAQYCDLIFAKDNLLKHCEKNRISFYPFKNFLDIKEQISKLLSKKRLRKSYQAFLKRKLAYEAE